MTGPDAIPAPVHGFIDADGRLIEAESRLAELNESAGGSIGAPLAVPSIARLASLARRLGVVVSRGVLVASGEDELDLWVRAAPMAEGVRLEITGWRAQPGWVSPVVPAARESGFVAADAEWKWESDAALRLTYLPPEAAARHGFEGAELLGQALTRLFVIETGGETFSMLDAVARRRAFFGQPAILRPTGERVELSAMPRLDSNGRFAGFSGGVRAGPASVAGTSTLPPALVAHLDRTLRLPLGKIIANADSISARTDGPLRGEYVGYASDIGSAARHLLDMVDDLADLDAIERPDFHLATEAIDLADLARRAAGLLSVRATTGGVRIDRPTADEVLPARGEFRRVLQILVNLIGNAVRYSPEGGAVWVRCERDGSAAAVIVADQGRGIAAADQARIFEKFERVDPGEPGGSGLGLYISRRLARAMGGDISVDSAPGQGARFMLTLPYRETLSGGG